MGPGVGLADALRLARLDSHVHEATELLHPLGKRFRAVEETLAQVASTGDRQAPVEQRFKCAAAVFVDLVGRQKATSLATRVVEFDSLACSVERLHKQLDDVLTAMGKRVKAEKWCGGFVKAKREYVGLLREAMKLEGDKMRRSEFLAREAITVLKDAREKRRWNVLANELWAVVEPFLSSMSQSDLPEWFIPESAIHFTSPIALDCGSYGVVYFAKWNGSDVAVKLVKSRVSMKRFIKEVEIWRSLSHPHVVKFTARVTYERHH